MKVTITIMALCLSCSFLAAAQGDWTNFLYVTSYGDSNYWFAEDTFAGGSGSNSFNHPQGVLATTSAVFVIDTGNDRVVKLSYGKTVVYTPEPSNAWRMAYASEWGTSGTGSNQLRFPTDAAFGNDGLIYIVDCSNHCIKICDTDGNWRGVFGTQGGDTNQFRAPRGICTVPVPLVSTNFYTNSPPLVVTNVVTNTVLNVIVADYGNDRVVEYDYQWQFVRAISNIVNYPPDGTADKLYQIWGPYDVLVITDNLYITEARRNSSSDYINARRLKGANNCNRFIMLSYSNGVYQDDWNVPEQIVTNSTGGFVTNAYGGFTGNVYQGIRGLIDFDGVLLTACADNSQSQYLITDPHGYIVGKFGAIAGNASPSPNEGQFAYPYNLAKSKSFVFCADSGNHRIQMWKANFIPRFDWPKTNWFSARELQVMAFTVHAIDDDGDAIVYSGVLNPLPTPLPNWLKNWGVNSEYMKFSMIPYRGSAGTDYTLTLTASDGVGSATMLVTLHVDPLNVKHKKLTKPPKAGAYEPCYEDWVFNTTDDGDLVSLKLKKGVILKQWDGSVLAVAGSPTVSVSAKRAKTLAGTGYDTVYGEIGSTNEVARAAVAQLDMVTAQEELKSVAVVGTLGRVLVSNAPLGKVSVKNGCLGGAQATTIKSVAVSAGKIKDVLTSQVRVIGGDLSGKYYPGDFGRIRATSADPKKLSSIGTVSLKGGDIADAAVYGKGHISKISVKEGKDENKLPIGGYITNSAIRAGVDAAGVVSTYGDVAGVTVSRSIEWSSILGAAYPGTKGYFTGTTTDPTELYYGSVKSIKYGKESRVFESLVVSSNAIKKLVVDPTTTVIINGQVQ